MIRALFITLMVLLTSACGSSDKDNGPKVISVEITTDLNSLKKGTTGIVLFVGDTLQFTATAHFDNGTSEVVSEAANWLSSQPDNMLVDSTGLVTAKVATHLIPVGLTATFRGVESSKIDIHIDNAYLEKITVSSDAQAVAVDTIVTYKATAHYSNGLTDDLTDSVFWSSTNFSVATIDQNGIAKANGIGSVDIQAHSGPIDSEIANLAVEEAEVTSIEVTVEHTELPAGIESQHKAFVHYASNSNLPKKEITQQVDWHSTDENVALINNDGSKGLVIGVAEGSAQIQATYLKYHSGESQLTINDAQLVSVEVELDSPIVAKGLFINYQAEATFSSNETFDITKQATWTSSEEGIIAIDQDTGLAYANKLGDTFITADFNAIKGSNKLSVTDATLVSLTIIPASSNLTTGLRVVTGQLVQLEAWGIYTDTNAGNKGTNLTSQVSWSVEGDATHRENGSFRGGNTAGEALITALVLDPYYNSVDSTTALLEVKDPTFGTCGNLTVDNIEMTCPLTGDEADAAGIKYENLSAENNLGYVTMKYSEAKNYCESQGAILSTYTQLTDLYAQYFVNLSDATAENWPIDTRGYWELDEHSSSSKTFRHLKTGDRRSSSNNEQTARAACALIH